jgi:hypothetical protein
LRDFVLHKAASLRNQTSTTPQQQPQPPLPIIQRASTSIQSNQEITIVHAPSFKSLPIQKQLDQLQERQLQQRQKQDDLFQQQKQPPLPTQPIQSTQLMQGTQVNEKLLDTNTIVDKFQSEFAPLLPANQESSKSIKEEKNEDEFFKKLQLLEMQRGAHINIQQPTNNPLSVENTQSTIQPSLLSLSQSQSQSQLQPSNTIIYMSNKNYNNLRNSKPIILCGASRMWVHIVERNMLVFKGPLPDSMHIRLTRLLLPKRVSRNTPCVNIHIKSAINKTMDVLCIFR